MSSRNTVFFSGGLNPDSAVPINMKLWPGFKPSADMSWSSLSWAPLIRTFWRSGGTPVREKIWNLNVDPGSSVSNSISNFLLCHLTTTRTRQYTQYANTGNNAPGMTVIASQSIRHRITLRLWEKSWSLKGEKKRSRRCRLGWSGGTYASASRLPGQPRKQQNFRSVDVEM